MKYKSPLNGNELWISQTYHITGGNKAIDFGSTPVGTPVYAMANGTIGTISTSLGSYLTLNVESSKHKLFYVHIYNFKVSQGQKVTQGQLLAEIAPKSANGGYNPHLHIGLQPEYGLMDYMDRSIAFRTKYQEIKDVWFNGETLNWALFKDLSYNDNVMAYKIGDKVEFTGTQNIRQGSGTNYPSTGSTQIGQTATIINGPRNADNYTWWDMQITGGGTGWLADVGKWKIYAAPPQAPEKPKELVECQSRVKSLEKEKGTLESKLGACEGSKSELVAQKGELETRANALEVEVSRLETEVSQLGTEVSGLKAEIKKQEEIEKILEEEVHTWMEKYDALYTTHNRVVKEKNEAIEELRQERLKECGPFEGIKLLFNKLLELIRGLGKS